MDAKTYAEGYAASHREPMTPDYVSGYAEFVLLDTMLTDYRLLIVGAGTGGFARLIKNHREIVCIDRDPEMIKKAIPTPRVVFQCADFKDFVGGTFDAISVAGTYGWYEPWTRREGVLVKCHAMLKSGGLLIASHVPPKNLFHRAKETLAPNRTVVMNHSRFLQMTKRHSFSELVRVHREKTSVSIFRATP